MKHPNQLNLVELTKLVERLQCLLFGTEWDNQQQRPTRWSPDIPVEAKNLKAAMRDYGLAPAGDEPVSETWLVHHHRNTVLLASPPPGFEDFKGAAHGTQARLAKEDDPAT